MFYILRASLMSGITSFSFTEDQKLLVHWFSCWTLFGFPKLLLWVGMTVNHFFYYWPQVFDRVEIRWEGRAVHEVIVFKALRCWRVLGIMWDIVMHGHEKLNQMPIHLSHLIAVVLNSPFQLFSWSIFFTGGLLFAFWTFAPPFSILHRVDLVHHQPIKNLSLIIDSLWLDNVQIAYSTLNFLPSLEVSFYG